MTTVIVEPVDSGVKDYFSPDKDKKPAARKFTGEINLDLDNDGNDNNNDDDDDDDDNDDKKPAAKIHLRRVIVHQARRTMTKTMINWELMMRRRTK